MGILYIPGLVHVGSVQCDDPAEPLSMNEEADFLNAMNDAVESGEITQEEADALIDREYGLL